MRINYRFTPLLLVFLLWQGTAAAHGGSHLNPKPSPEQKNTFFVANKGQWAPFVHFIADVPGGRAFLEEGRITWGFIDNHDLHDRFFQRPESRNEPLLLKAHGVQVNFEGANPHPLIEGGEKLEAYHNYFIGNDPSKWAGGVPLFSRITYRELYPGTDLAIMAAGSSLKYEFHLQPGADPSRIRLRYEGADQLFVDEEGRLHLVTSVNEVIEAAPVVYYVTGGEKIACRFVVNGKVLTYDFPEGVDLSREWVIDPTLVFSTFTGSTADNFGFTATYDDLGFFYAGGIAFGVGYPTVGAFQAAFGGGGVGGAWTMNGGIDVSLTKYNPTGTAIVWSTYMGGTANEQPHSLITNPAGELHIYGVAWSANFPTSVTGFDPTHNGGGDIFVAKLSAAGNVLLGSTFVGGSLEDGVNVTSAFGELSLKHNYGDDSRGEIMLDAGGNVYVSSCTQSTDFPTASAAQPAFGGGTQDGCAFRLTPTLNALTWSTYLGGSAADACYSIKVDLSLNAYVAGGTESANFPTTAGALQTVFSGVIDGFVTRISSTGASLDFSTFIGTAAYDQVYFVELDQNEDVYIYGQTLGNIPMTPGVYGTPNAPQFLMKLDPALSAITWATTFGTAGFGTVNISPTALLVDICGFVYISGWGGAVNAGGSTTGMDVTLDAYQSTTDGSDFYLMVLEKDALSLVYATFFGGPVSAEHVDGGTSRFNRNLEIYQAVCAGCGANSDFPTTPGAVSNTNNSSNCNEGSFKFAFDPQTIISAFVATPFDSCAPFPVTFINESTGGVMWIWNYGDGSPPDTTLTPMNMNHLYPNPGSYPVTLTVIDSNSCNVVDTITQTVTVHANPISTSTGGGTVCNGAVIQLFASGGSSYQWLPAAGLNNPNVANPIASPSVTTTYMVIASDTFGCVDTSYATVVVNNYAAEAGPPVSFCAGSGGTQLFAGTPSGGTGPYWYEWTCDTTSTWCGLDSVFDNDPIANPSQTTTYYLQVTDFFGCLSQLDSVVVEVLPLPIVDAGPDQWICSDSAPGAFITPSICCAPGPYTTMWSPAIGLNDPALLSPYARPDTTTEYTLIVTSSNGCSSLTTTVDSTSTVIVHVLPLPVAHAGPDIDLCYLDSVMIPGFGTDAGPAYAFQWSPAQGVSDTADANPMVSPAATTEYYLTVWSNGCPSISDTVVVNVHTLPTVNAGPDVETCLGDSVLLDAQAGGDPTSTSYSFVWTPGIYLSNDSIEDPMASPPSTAFHFVEAISSWGCHSPLDSALVTLKPTPIAEAGDPVIICAGDSIVLDGSFYYTTTDPAPVDQVYFSWTPSSQVTNATIAQPGAAPTQTTMFYLTVMHNTCSTLDSVLVNVKPAVNLLADADTSVICQHDSVQLHAAGGSGGATFVWIPATGLSDPTSPNPMAAPDSNMVYTVIASEGGCHDTMEVALNVIPSPEVAFMSSLRQGCVPFTVSFLDLSSDVLLHTWFFGDGNISNETNPLHTYTQPGEYYVTLQGANSGNCAKMGDSLLITVSDTARPGFNTDPAWPMQAAVPGVLIHFFDESQQALTWTWSFGDGFTSQEMNPNHSYTEPGEYYVTLQVTNRDGCVSEITQGPFIITVPDLFIPNVFSPNEDGINDEFFIRYTGSQPFTFTIYDRWGGELYAGNNPNTGWNGTYEGQPVPDGVYYYAVVVGGKTYHGNVTLLR